MTSSPDTRICVYQAPDPIEGNLIRGLLESAGIDVELRGELLSGAYPGVPRVSETRLFVRPHQRDAARRVVKDYEKRHAQQRHWTCERCGEANTAAFETCWQCQSAGPDQSTVAG